MYITSIGGLLMLENEGNTVRTMVAEKMSDPDTPAIEERNIQEVFVEEENDAIFVNAINNIIQQNTHRPRDQRTPITAGRFFSESVPYDLTMPEEYVIRPEGTYLIHREEDDPNIKLVHLTNIPFFVAQKTETGKVLLVRRVNNIWLRDWVPAKSIMSRNTYLDMMIFPKKGIKMKTILDYSVSCLAVAPYVHIPDTTLMSILANITEDHQLDENARYPVLVNVSSVKEICETHEMSYNKVRTWLSQRNIIEHESNLQRDRHSGKPTRFLVVKRPLSKFVEEV